LSNRPGIPAERRRAFNRESVQAVKARKP